MIIKAKRTFNGILDLSSLERLQEDNHMEALPFRLTIKPGQLIEVDDKWYTLTNIQSSLKAGYIEILDYKQQNPFTAEISVPESLTSNLSLIKVEILNRADYPQDAFIKYNQNFEDLGNVVSNIATSNSISNIINTISNIESEIIDINIELANAQNDITDIEIRVSNVESDIADINLELANTQGDITDIEIRVSNVESDITDINLSLDTKANISGQVFTGNISALNLSGDNTGDETKLSIETKLGASNASNDGYLTSDDWNSFSNAVSNVNSLPSTYLKLDQTIPQIVNNGSPTFATSIITPKIIGGSETTSDLYLQSTSNVGATGADIHFLVGNNGATEALTILNNGNVGVNNNAPTYKLDIVSAARVSDYLDAGSGLRLQAAYGMFLNSTNAIIWSSGSGITSGYDTSLTRYAANTVSVNSSVVGSGNLIAGKVGIGTLAPSSKLEVIGSLDAIQAIIRANSTQNVNIQEWQSSDSAMVARIGKSGYGEFSGLKSSDITTSNGYIYASAGFPLQLYTSAILRLYINNTTGKTGIGTSSPDKQLEINSSTGDNLRLTYNDSNGSAINYTDLLVSSSGDLTILPSGGEVVISGNVSAVNITGTNIICSSNVIADNSAIGDIIDDILAGETIAFPNLVYLNSSGKWNKANATSIATCQGLFGLTLESKVLDEPCKVLVRGFAKDSSWSWSNVGSPIFSSIVAGELSQNTPNQEDNVILMVGTAINSNRVYFNPQTTTFEYKV